MPVRIFIKSCYQITIYLVIHLSFANKIHSQYKPRCIYYEYLTNRTEHERCGCSVLELFFYLKETATMADDRIYNPDDLMDDSVNEEDLTAEIPGQYALAMRRRNDADMDDGDGQTSVLSAPVKVPDMQNDMWENFTTRDEFMQAAYRYGHVCMGTDVVIFHEDEVVLTTGELHPLLWDKYAEMIIREITSNVERASSATEAERRFWYSYTELGHDVWVRMGKEYTWQKMIQGMRVIPLFTRYDWPMDIVNVARLMDSIPTKYSLSFANFTAIMVRMKLERMMTRYFVRNRISRAPSGTAMPDDYKEEPRALFAYDFKDYMKLGFTYKDMLSIIWSSFVDKERAHLRRSSPILSSIEEFNILSITDNPGQHKTVMYHGHLAYFARKMLLRNKQIEGDRINEDRPWSLPHNICEMVALVPQNMTYDANDDVGAFYYFPGEERFSVAVSPRGTSYAMIFPVLLSGTPTLYQLLERYLYLDPNYPDNIRNGTLTRVSLWALSFGVPYTTVPLIFGLVRYIKKYPDTPVDIGAFAAYIGDIFDVTQHPAPTLAYAPMWLPSIRKFVIYIQHAKTYAERRIFNMKFINNIRFTLPRISSEPFTYRLLYREDSLEYPGWLVAHVLLTIANNSPLLCYAFTLYLYMLPVSLRGYVAAHAPAGVTYSYEGPIMQLDRGSIDGLLETREPVKSIVYEVERNIYETIDDVEVDKNMFEHL